MIKNKFIKDCLFFGIDNLEFTVKDIKQDFVYYSYLANIDTDNSPRGYIELFDMEFTYTKFNTYGYLYGLKFETIIDGKIVDCFSILKGKELKLLNASKSKDKVVLYSSFFILDYLGKLPFSIIEFYGLCFKNYKKNIVRLDLAYDVPYTIKKLQKGLFKGTEFFSEIGHDKKHPEFSQTYYIKNPKSSENRNYIIRIYDKILDTFKKQKGFLYPHLKNNYDVRRIELELRTNQCNTLNYSVFDLLHNKDNVLEKIFFKFLNKNINKPIMDINYNDLLISKKVNIKYDLKSRFLELGHIPKDYISMAYGYIKNIKTNTGYNGLFQLLLGYKKDNNGEPLNINLGNGYELLENLVIYLKKEGLRESLIKKILKKHISKSK